VSEADQKGQENDPQTDSSQIMDQNPDPQDLDVLPVDREPEEAEIDSFLAKEDPDFFSKMGELRADSQLKVEEIIIDDETEALHREIARWAEAKGPRRWSYLLLPFLPRLTLIRKRLWRKFSAAFVSASIATRNTVHDWVKTIFRESKRHASESLTQAQANISSFMRGLRFMSARLKMLWFGTLLLTVLALAGIYLAVSGRILPVSKELFISSFQEAGAEEFRYDSSRRPELFYDNVRSAPNMLLVPKIVANIRPSENSGENPMVAVEFFAEGLSSEVILEMKDREPFFRDAMQRRIEDFSFDVLDTPPGKRALTDALLKDLNRTLTQGELKALRIKTIVLKP